jgi:hypothetical protein
MKTTVLKLAFPLLILATASSAPARNVVGYANVGIYPGDNFIANQLTNAISTLDRVLSGSTPDGSTFTKWDPLGNQFLPLSTYSAANRTWSINYTFTTWEGALFHSPSAFTNTFQGSIDQRAFIVDGGTNDGFIYANFPHYDAGLYLISCPVPIPANFTNVVGRGPFDGEWVETLNPATQTYTVTTFHALSGAWDNGAPSLRIGESAFFNLVPEPGAISLSALGVFVLACGFRPSRRGKEPY